ncbi:ArgJ family-domain-containing protein [Pisolithus marmoratus]|nr:ArgJ family-domain-containing protein [Pisolithus marmoratus]
MDKGAGMIRPRMAALQSLPTASLHAALFGLILTNALVSPWSSQSTLRYAVDRTFNSIFVDGDMSTNDTTIALANGANKVEEIDEELEVGYHIFRGEFTMFAIDLSKLVVRDDEGATKFVEVPVENTALGAHSSKQLSTMKTPRNVSFIPSLPKNLPSTPPPTLINGEPAGDDEARTGDIGTAQVWDRGGSRGSECGWERGRICQDLEIIVVVRLCVTPTQA